MTNATTTSTAKSTQGFARVDRKSSDAAPMVINRLSGWIDVGEAKAEMQGWIIPTRIHAPAR
jgi:hypothetical protein